MGLGVRLIQVSNLSLLLLWCDLEQGVTSNLSFLDYKKEDSVEFGRKSLQYMQTTWHN